VQHHLGTNWKQKQNSFATGVQVADYMGDAASVRAVCCLLATPSTWTEATDEPQSPWVHDSDAEGGTKYADMHELLQLPEHHQRAVFAQMVATLPANFMFGSLPASLHPGLAAALLQDAPGAAQTGSTQAAGSCSERSTSIAGAEGQEVAASAGKVLLLNVDEECKEIPGEPAACCRAPLSRRAAPALFAQLPRCPSIVAASFRGHVMSCEDIVGLQRALAPHTALTSLDFSGNCATERDIAALGEMLACWPRLRELRLHQTFSSIPNASHVLAAALTPLSQLTLLAVPGIGVTCGLSRALQELRELDLSGGTGTLNVLACLPHLTKLSVSGGGFSTNCEQSGAAVARAVGKCTALRWLNVRHAA
jgi:hypothetical protein